MTKDHRWMTVFCKGWVFFMKKTKAAKIYPFWRHFGSALSFETLI